MRSILRLKPLCIFCFLLFQQSLFAQPDVIYLPVIPASAGLSAPIEVVNAPGQPAQRLYVVEQRGTIRIWDGTQLLSPAFLDIQSIVNFDGNERGLLSVAFPPDFATNGGYFYCYYNANNGNITISRFRVSADPDIAVATPDPATPLISIPKLNTNHNGGHLQFRTEGGQHYLYFATGDGGGSNDPNVLAQNYQSYLGKMIRINTSVPGSAPEIIAWGLRNPFRWSFDRSTGDIWIGDVGQGSREELNFLTAGSIGTNYGWPCMEGTEINTAAPAGGDCDTVRAVDVLPIYDYDNPTLGRSIVGGYVYRGTEFPSMQGYYFFTDFFATRLWMVRPDGAGGWEINSKTGMASNIASISEGSDGSLYAVSLGSGIVYKLVVPVITPLRLTVFSGKSFGTYHELNWTTESATGIEKFVVESSTDARTFTAIGELAARNNADRTNYSFRHQPLMGATTVYYRLRIEEINGVYSYSPVISIGDGRYTGIKIFPTVIQTRSLNIISGLPVEQINIIGLDGRNVLSRQLNGVEGYIHVPLNDLQKGYYLVQVVARGLKQTEKILVQ